MKIQVTDNAKNQIQSLMTGTKFKNPVIRVNAAGFG
jgi:Fe-S cluster assembly iron-binding protein IscA